MLNTVLVEMLIAVHRTRRTGLLALDSAQGRRGVGFVNGEPVALQMAGDKNSLVAAKLIEMHRATAEEVEARTTSGNVAAALVADQIVTQAEHDQATQALVEDELVSLLAGEGQPEFVEISPEVLDYASSAIRMRIDPQTLIKTAGARVAEDALVAEQVGGSQSVFAFSEGAGSMPLSEDERQTLNQIDGQRTIEDIAISARFSTRHVARLMRSLLAKGLVRRLADRGTRTIRNFTPVLTADRQPDFIGGVVRPARRSPMVLIGLACLLVVTAGVFWMMKNYQDRNAQRQILLDRASNAIDKQEWEAANTALSEASKDAGQDLSAQRRVKEVETNRDQALSKARKSIETAISERRFDGLAEAISRLPVDSDSASLRIRLNQSVEQFNQASRSIVAQVEAAILRQDLATAAEIINAQPSPERDAANQILVRERVNRLENARTNSVPLARRRLLITQVASASPTPSQVEQLAIAKQELIAASDSWAATLREFITIAESGDIVTAQRRIVQDEIERMVADSDLTPVLQRLQMVIARANEQMSSAIRDMSAYIAGDMAMSATTAYEQIASAQRSYPKHEQIETARRLGALAQSIDATAKSLSIEQELPRLRERLAITGNDDRALIEQRIRRIEERAASAVRLLDAAVDPLREQDYSEVERRLLELLAHPLAQRSTVLADAQQRLGEVRERIKRRAVLEVDLNAAMAKGDIAAAVAIARDMGERNLPVRIESLPSGATVSVAGTVIGVTPLTMRMPALQRTSSTFRLTLPGYIASDLPGAAADGGWRLLGTLQRQQASAAALGQLVTAAPTTVNGQLVTASRQYAMMLADGQSKTTPLDRNGSPDTSPLVAAPARLFNALWFVAPEGTTWRVSDAGKVDRWVLPMGSRFAPAATASEFVADRQWLIVAGDNGKVVVHDPRTGNGWQGAAGATFMAAPLVIGDRILTVRSDGTCESVAVEDGAARRVQSLGESVLSAWSDGTAFHILTANRLHRWSGGELRTTPLPSEAIHGGVDAFIAAQGRVWTRDATGAWAERGQLTAAVSKPRISQWNQHGVVISGDTVQVVGPRAFTHRAGHQIVGVTVLGEALVVVDVDGRVTTYAP